MFKVSAVHRRIPMRLKSRRNTVGIIAPRDRRMSFIFPVSFYVLLSNLSRRHEKDMTYIVMEAVNEWVVKREKIHLDDEIPIAAEDDVD